MAKDKQALIDILKAIQQIISYVEDIKKEDLQQDDEKQAAILYRIIIVGEATKRLSPEFRQQYPMIPWREMAGLRDVVIHDYDELDFDILWNVIQVNLPDILPQIQLIFNSLND
ncbi:MULTISPECIES: HepT-like ribonuclease domain-containing protein [Limnospira]|uniref:Nucleotidyltransferase n=3 Tax=Limnospira TaxID=2596745 RepID=B5W1X5_LIMMA|nr:MULTISPECIES: DUF86 domain-containing protein [Limnospira]UWU45571.1 putative conserved protein, contains HEPN domain [Arthrospira platensis C1]EDZ94409.1 protein of unknown function DUF86 [Limnospira maxima CS-328]MDT9191070.1 DUF86 domain-containing protein [Limnospira sp. PMC 894.15]MDT9236981.1 DUF86 domain-containing protein [Limnospira sp. PMC 917.15]MDT9277807.1 DUF86 domain-containing protein [Limnospira sp. PMC 737.11]